MEIKQKVIIVSDSTSDLGSDLIQKYNIKINPLYIVMGEDSLKDGLEIQPDDIYKYVSETKALPKTSAASVSDHYDFLQPLVQDGYSVIYFTISSSMSANYNNARLAANELENVYVIDSKNLSSAIGIQIIFAAELAKDGLSAKEIYQKVIDLQPHIDASFVINNVEYLYKGGRCSSIEALGANLLNLKPCIAVKNGSMSVEKKYRGKFYDVVMKYISDRLNNADDVCHDIIFITHSGGCDEKLLSDAKSLIEESVPFIRVYTTRAGCTISNHCGAGTLGILFIRNSIVK